MPQRLAESVPARSSPWWRTARFVPVMEDWAWRARKFIWIFLFAFYVLSFNGLWRLGPDSALYMSLARSIARGEGYLYHGEVHRLAYPGLPYLLAGLMKLAPAHFMLLANLLMTCGALLALYLCYRLFCLVVRPQAALVVTVLFAINQQLYELAFEVLTDIPFLLGTLLVLLGGALTGVLSAPRLDPEAAIPSPRARLLGWFLLPSGILIAAVMRPTFYLLAAAMLAAVAVSAIARKKSARRLMGYAAAAIVLAAVAFIVLRYDPRRATGERDVYENALIGHLQIAAANWQQPFMHAWRLVSPELPSAFFGFSWSPVGDPIIVAILLAAAGWTLWRWPMAIMWIAATLLVQCIVPPVPRYMLPILPLLILAWWCAIGRVTARLPSIPGNILAWVAFLVLVPNAFRCIGQVCYEQWQRPFIATYHYGVFAPLYEMAPQIAAHVPADATIVAPFKTDRILTYLAERNVFNLEDPDLWRFRDHPLWAVIASDDQERLAALNRNGIVLGPPLAVAPSLYRKVGVLELRKAYWPGETVPAQ